MSCFILLRNVKASRGLYIAFPEKTEEVTEFLKAKGIECAFYHAGMNSDERSSVQEAFIKDDIKIICATIAFGMGIDKSNIRWIIHYNLPKNMEGYYQEIGRAGRDGLKSDTLLFYSVGDVVMLSKFAEESGQPEINKEKLLRIQQYAESRVCRRRILLNYFGDNFNRNCNNCDVCSDPPKVSDGTIAAQKALSALIRSGECVGINMLIYILRGSQNAELLEKGFQNIKTFGIGKEHSFETWQSYVLQFLQLGLIEIAYDDGFSLKVTAFGMSVVKGTQKIGIVESRPAHHHIFNEDNNNDFNASEDDLFEKLRVLRKKIADREKLPPYIVFTDKTLHEMVEFLPLTEQEMLAVQGVSQNKFDKYGDDFLDLIARENNGSNKQVKVNVKEILALDKLMEFIQSMQEKDIRVSHHTLTKILLGSDKISFPEKVTLLPFFGILKNNIKHKDLSLKLKTVFEEKIESKQRHPADSFFTDEVYNNIGEITRNQLPGIIATLPVNRPTATITNEFILNQRITHPRSYETWLEPEITVFREAISQTNDLEWLSTIFQRSSESLKAYYKKTFMNQGVF